MKPLHNKNMIMAQFAKYIFLKQKTKIEYLTTKNNLVEDSEHRIYEYQFQFLYVHILIFALITQQILEELKRGKFIYLHVPLVFKPVLKYLS